MPKTARTARERWRQFLSFLIGWVLAAIAASALLIYFTAGPEPTPDQDAPASVALDVPDTAPEPFDAANTDTTPPSPAEEAAPAPAPVPERVRNDVGRAPTPKAAVPKMREAERASQVASHIRRASDATEAGDYDAATRAYESALELDPNNFEVKILMWQVTSLSDIAAAESGPPRFRHSRTELTPTGASDRSLAAELFIEILPAAPNPGDPYIVRVRARNASPQSLALASVELLESHESLASERARPAKPLAQQLGPNETALLWERRADWMRADRTGTLLVAVTLDDGSKLSKSVSW